MKTFTIQIGEGGVEISVINLTDMPDLLGWALSTDEVALSLPLSVMVSKGPWRGENMVTAAESFFQKNAYHPFAMCSTGHTNPMPMSKVGMSKRSEADSSVKRRELHHFCQHRDCMSMDAEHFRSNRNDIKDTDFLTDRGVFAYRTISKPRDHQ